MKTLENQTDLCVQKVMANDRESTTFQKVKEGHRLYDCTQCTGTPGRCPDYHSYNALANKYGLRDR